MNKSFYLSLLPPPPDLLSEALTCTCVNFACLRIYYPVYHQITTENNTTNQQQCLKIYKKQKLFFLPALRSCPYFAGKLSLIPQLLSTHGMNQRECVKASSSRKDFNKQLHVYNYATIIIVRGALPSRAHTQHIPGTKGNC